MRAKVKADIVKAVKAASIDTYGAVQGLLKAAKQATGHWDIAAVDLTLVGVGKFGAMMCGGRVGWKGNRGVVQFPCLQQFLLSSAVVQANGGQCRFADPRSGKGLAMHVMV
jgi:hypothetical protein